MTEELLPQEQGVTEEEKISPFVLVKGLEQQQKAIMKEMAEKTQSLGGDVKEVLKLAELLKNYQMVKEDCQNPRAEKQYMPVSE